MIVYWLIFVFASIFGVGQQLRWWWTTAWGYSEAAVQDRVDCRVVSVSDKDSGGTWETQRGGGSCLHALSCRSITHLRLIVALMFSYHSLAVASPFGKHG